MANNALGLPGDHYNTLARLRCLSVAWSPDSSNLPPGSLSRPYPVQTLYLTHQGFITEVAKEMGLPPESSPGIRSVNAAEDAVGRPLPPYLSTVNNLGLNNTPGMPNLAVCTCVNRIHSQRAWPLLTPMTSGQSSALRVVAEGYTVWEAASEAMAVVLRAILGMMH